MSAEEPIWLTYHSVASSCIDFCWHNFSQEKQIISKASKYEHNSIMLEGCWADEAQGLLDLHIMKDPR
jgi:hypothetical protein